MNNDIESPLTINNVTFPNRILRSSVGGRHSTYDGTVTDVWKNFEKRFADAGVGGVISTTFHVNRFRLSPMQYPSIAEERFVSHLKKFIPQIKRDAPNCKYIVQIGDPGYVTYESLFVDPQDALSSSNGFDLAFGYMNTRRAMTEEQIKQSIADHAAAARRVRDAGADGVEIAAAKGYLIHQFLNPAFNLRKDDWGGSPEKRFQFLDRVVSGVRKAVGKDFLVGVRLAAADHNLTPPAFALMRWPSPLLSRTRRLGNNEDQMIEYAQKIQRRVDYLHIVSGFGFPSPRETPGDFPFDEVKMFFHQTHMLTRKTRLRSSLVTLAPKFLLRPWLSLGWHYEEAINREAAARFKREVQDCRIIVNGGFRERRTIETALQSHSADMVSMARALLATPNLAELLSDGHDVPKRCSGCNKCVGRTGTSPLGCYDARRFGGDKRRMYNEILKWNQADLVPDPIRPDPIRAAPVTERADAPPTSVPLEIMESSLRPHVEARPDAK